MVSPYLYNVLTELLKQNVMDIGLSIWLSVCSFIQIWLIIAVYIFSNTIFCTRYCCADKKRTVNADTDKSLMYREVFNITNIFILLCCGYTLTDFPISIRLTSLALWQSNDCPSASKATLINMDKYLMWIHYERLHNHNKTKHNKTACIFLGIYCISWIDLWQAVGIKYALASTYCRDTW